MGLATLLEAPEEHREGRLRGADGGILRPLLIAVAAGLIVAALATWLGLH